MTTKTEAKIEGATPQSSYWPKNAVKQWLEEELARTSVRAGT